jgi:tetratricopeptide (TPR) repeat protein
MNAAEKAVLIANANHAEPLRALTAKQWQEVEQRLEKSGLLLGKKGTFERLEWDTHPIIRAYFGEEFKEKYSEAFKQAHLVLFEYYRKLPEKEFPDTSDEMKPLYLAVKHGCLAGEYYKADFDIYWKRIRRSNEGYSIHKLGLYSEDLVALSAFFSSGWHELIATGLNEENQAWLLSTTSFCLMSLGYLSEASTTRLANLNLREKQKDWENASRAAQTLVDVYLPLGQLLLAENTAQQAFDYAQSIDDRVRQLECQCYLATVHYHCGRFKESFKYFQQAERLEQKELNQYLTSGYGFDYCQLLLASAQDEVVLQRIITRSEYSLKAVKNLLSMALDYLTLARVHAVLNESIKADSYFQKAIQDIQKANRIDLTPSFYLDRADFYLTQNQLSPALADLNSAWEIIERCGMKLYAVDYLLIHGRYSLATADFDTALNHYEEAKQLIEETGYHLRDAELDLFAAKLRGQCGENYRSTNPDLYSKKANDYLQKAKNRIADIGQWGLMRVIKRDFPNQA